MNIEIDSCSTPADPVGREFVITSDIDWAPDYVLADALELFEQCDVRVTLLATHSTEVLMGIDEGKYEESWDESSSMFKNSVTKEQWVETMKINRPQFGKVLQRDVKTKSYETNISGKPDLEHVVIQFQTKFEHKAKGIETITPAKDRDGVWRVWGYYIK